MLSLVPDFFEHAAGKKMPKVVFFVPNLIGYVRVLLFLASFYFMPNKPLLAVAFYFMGGIVLDVLDGVSARYLNQCSKYGDLLDWLTDRCGRIGMLMTLCIYYPQHLLAFQVMVCLEISGCFSNRERFAINKTPGFQRARGLDPLLLRAYFTEPVLTLTIFGQDLCLAMLYLLHFSAGPTVSVAGTSVSLWVVLAWIGAPFFVYRQIVVCGLALFCSFAEIAEHDEEERRKVGELKPQ